MDWLVSTWLDTKHFAPSFFWSAQVFVTIVEFNGARAHPRDNRGRIDELLPFFFHIDLISLDPLFPSKKAQLEILDPFRCSLLDEPTKRKRNKKERHQSFTASPPSSRICIMDLARRNSGWKPAGGIINFVTYFVTISSLLCHLTSFPAPVMGEYFNGFLLKLKFIESWRMWLNETRNQSMTSAR